YQKDPKEEERLEKKDSQPDDLKELIMDGMKVEVGQQVKKLLSIQESDEIIREYFIPALDQVGEKYEKGEFFLPQLLRAAEAVKQGLDVIKARSVKVMGQENQGKVLLATVKGDIHDIGKNIAKMLLENYGFKVVD